MASGSLIFSGNISAPAWTTNGIRHVSIAATLTDTSSVGTVANAYSNNFGGNTIAASNAVTFTNYSTVFINAPVAGTNVTITNPYSIITAAGILVNSAVTSTSTATGALQVVGGVGIGGSVYIGNTATITSTVNATSTATGAFQVRGGVGIGGSVYIGNTATITSTVSSTSTNSGALQVVGGVGIGGNLVVGGTTTLKQTQEVMVPLVSPGATAALNFNTGTTFYITGMTSNFTAAFSNVPTSANYVYVSKLILVQGGTAYVANAVSINGTTQTIRWLGGSTATVTANRTDVISVTLVATGTNAYTVLASGGEYY